MATISFQNRINDKQGTYYGQRIRVDRETFSKLQDIVASEIAMGYPNKLKYTFGDTDLIYIKPLYLENNVCFLSLTLLRFLSRYLNDKRINLNVNSYLFVS